MNNILCKVSSEKLLPVHDFGKQPLGNGFLTKKDFVKEYFFDMSIGFSKKSLLLQLLQQPSIDEMFHDEYAFFSSTSSGMKKHFKKFADQIISSKYLCKEDPFVIELGCNDGILIENFAKNKIRHLGIEPSLNVAEVARRKGINVVTKFFNSNLASEIISKYDKADVFIAANVMCHIPSLNDVIEGIKLILKPSGVVIFEDPYLGDVIKKNSYDQIYDEHVFIFSALAIEKVFNNFGMELINLEPQTTHGGSMRYFLAHKGFHQKSENVQTIINNEISLGLNKISTFNKFSENVKKSKADLIKLLNKIKGEGKSIAGYAATSKSTTILNYCQIGPDIIDYITDITPIKQNKFSPGMHIPIVDYEYFKNNPPDYAFLFAWNHAKEIMDKEQDFIKSGGKWITHIPEVKIL